MGLFGTDQQSMIDQQNSGLLGSSNPSLLDRLSNGFNRISPEALMAWGAAMSEAGRPKPVGEGDSFGSSLGKANMAGFAAQRGARQSGFEDSQRQSNMIKTQDEQDKQNYISSVAGKYQGDMKGLVNDVYSKNNKWGMDLAKEYKSTLTNVNPGDTLTDVMGNAVASGQKKETKPMVEMNFPIGDNKVQPHQSFDNGVTWVPLSGSKTNDRFSPNVGKSNFGSTEDPDKLAATIEDIATYKKPPITGRASLTPAGLAIANGVKAFHEQNNSKFDGTRFASSQRSANAFSAGRQGDTVRAFNVTLNHMKSFEPLIDALNNGDVSLINKIGNEVGKQLGSPAITNFDAARDIIANEVVKSIVGGQNALGDRKEARERILSAKSPAQLKGVLDTYRELMIGQLDGLKTQYSSNVMRDDFDERFLTGQSKELVKNKKMSATNNQATGGWSIRPKQ